MIACSEVARRDLSAVRPHWLVFAAQASASAVAFPA
jgi:hypothetical protein